MKFFNPTSVAKSIGKVWQIVASKDVDIKTKSKLIMNPSGLQKQKPEPKPRPEPQDEEQKNIETINENNSEIPEEVWELKKERDRARKEKNWQKSNELREEIERAGFDIEGENIVRKI
jgi:cysteinyl-tRNA synthetase